MKCAFKCVCQNCSFNYNILIFITTSRNYLFDINLIINRFFSYEISLSICIHLDATTTDLPPGVLYRVKATYGYVKEDVDELSFEVGDIIRVIEYDDPEDQVRAY